jgi:hypothetical protein
LSEVDELSEPDCGEVPLLELEEGLVLEGWFEELD